MGEIITLIWKKFFTDLENTILFRKINRGLPMTRINLVPPSELYDQHLIAEYREIFMVPASLKRTFASKKGFRQSMIPTSFTLNRGHVSFFYDKGLYLENRYRDIKEEMRLRGMYTDPSRIFPSVVFPPSLYRDWKPSENDLSIIRERITLRISQRPGWYRKTPYVGNNQNTI
jgi:deoxyribonuclease (pyrimidine dimer)